MIHVYCYLCTKLGEITEIVHKGGHSKRRNSNFWVSIIANNAHASYNMIGDLIIPVDSVSISLGMGLSPLKLE